MNQQSQITKRDISNEINRLNSIILFDSSKIIARSARKKKDWILDWIRSEQGRGFRGTRSRCKNLSELEEV